MQRWKAMLHVLQVLTNVIYYYSDHYCLLSDFLRPIPRLSGKSICLLAFLLPIWFLLLNFLCWTLCIHALFECLCSSRVLVSSFLPLHMSQWDSVYFHKVRFYFLPYLQKFISLDQNYSLNYRFLVPIIVWPFPSWCSKRLPNSMCAV